MCIRDRYQRRVRGHSVETNNLDMVKFVGKCYCGGVEYEVDGEPIFAAFCHCRHCRKTTGQPFIAINGFQENNLTWRKKDTLASYTPPTGPQKLFCSHCGTNIGNHVTRMNIIGVHLATIVEGEPKKPVAHINLESKADFVQIPEDGLPRFPGFPPSF
eukprot:TRINITY_DN813_c0_g1_i1.p1 TRINITY_DN813_c0_g1~~TRINITY_DN813_c0_g1_i1.p1  ORF type:complete len:158 (+),score=37.12 TRINITY_DN813_c0_g1_i1:23-496(+)